MDYFEIVPGANEIVFALGWVKALRASAMVSQRSSRVLTTAFSIGLTSGE